MTDNRQPVTTDHVEALGNALNHLQETAYWIFLWVVGIFVLLTVILWKVW